MSLAAYFNGEGGEKGLQYPLNKLNGRLSGHQLALVLVLELALDMGDLKERNFLASAEI